MSYSRNILQAIDGETAKHKQALNNALRLGYNRKPVLGDKVIKHTTRLLKFYLKGL